MVKRPTVGRSSKRSQRGAVPLFRRVGRMRRADRHEKLFLAIDKVRGVERGELEAVAVRDGVGGASLDAVSAEDAAVVIDVVHRGVALGARDAALGSVLGGLDVDAVRWAGR